MVTKSRHKSISLATSSIALGLTLVAVLGTSTPALAPPMLNAYVDQPFVQGPGISGVQIETFDSACPTTWWSGSGNPGTMSGPCQSVNGNIFGGASTTSGAPSRGGGSPQTKYGAVFNGGLVTVTLDHPASYLGFQWSAGDRGNTITLYSGASEVATFTTQDLLAMLHNDDMGSWSANDYLINPARDRWIGEPFAYIYLTGVGGVTFDSFTISQPAYGFEFDNFSLDDRQVPVPATAISIGEETIPDVNGNGIDDTAEDSDGDGIADPFEDVDGNDVADVFDDSDGDGTSDYVERLSLADTGINRWAAVSLGVIGIGFAGLGVMMRVRRRPRTY